MKHVSLSALLGAFLLFQLLFGSTASAQNGVIPKYKNNNVFRVTLRMKKLNNRIGYSKKHWYGTTRVKDFKFDDSSDKVFNDALKNKVENKFKTKTPAEKNAILKKVKEYYAQDDRTIIQPGIVIVGSRHRKKLMIYVNNSSVLIHSQITRVQYQIDTNNAGLMKLDVKMEDTIHPPTDVEYEALQRVQEKKIEVGQTLSDSLDALVSYGYFMGQQDRFVFLPFTFPFIPHYKHLQKSFNQYYYSRSKVVSPLTGLDATIARGVTNINTELASGFFGIIRIGVTGNANIAGTAKGADSVKQAETEQRAEYQKLFSNGGQVGLTISCPVLIAHSESEDFHLTFSLFNKSATDVFANGAVDTAFKFLNQMGGNLYIDMLTDNQAVGISAEFPFAYVGGNAAFYKSTGLTDYSLLQCSLGVSVNNKFKIKVIGPLWCSNKILMRQPWGIGFQISP